MGERSYWLLRSMNPRLSLSPTVVVAMSRRMIVLEQMKRLIALCIN
jgi:hypothetical protein